jgi:anaerobic selenocysteine-containing dehydrogenase
MADANVRTERTFCRVCASLCGILLDFEGDQVVRVRGDKEHPLSRGYTCPKGRALPQMHNHPERLERPMMRVDGKLQPTSWTALLDDLGAKLRRIIDEHGPSAVGVYYGSGLGMDGAGFRLAHALTKAIGTRAIFSPLTIDHAGKVLAQTLVGGSPLLHARLDYDRVKLIIFAGTNPMISHGHPVAIPNPARLIRRVAAEGEVWAIDPHRTETAAFATRHIAPRPGGDWAIFAYLVRGVLRQGASPAAIARSTGVEELRAAVEPFDAERAADIAGVPAEDLAVLLAAIRKAGRLAVEIGTGVTMAAKTANVSCWLAWSLMVLTDSMNRPGGMWFHPGFFTRVDSQPLPPAEPFGPGPQSRLDLQSFIGDWPCAALPDAIEAGEIRAFLNFSGAMMRSFPDAHALKPALQKLEVFMTLDVVANDTADLSTHLMPPKDQLERPDIVLWDRISSRINAHYTPAMVKTVGERRAAWWMLAELMRRLGYEPPFALPADDQAPDADDKALAAVAVDGRCTFEELTRRRYVDMTGTFELPAQWVDDHVERIGGWRLAPPLLLAELERVAGGEPQPAPLVLTPRRQRRHLNASYDFLDAADVLLHPSDAETAKVQDGQPVIVRSERGELVATARVDAKIRPGVVSVPHGFGEANVNLLTSTRAVDPITGMAIFGAFPVTVHPAA